MSVVLEVARIIAPGAFSDVGEGSQLPYREKQASAVLAISKATSIVKLLSGRSDLVADLAEYERTVMRDWLNSRYPTDKVERFLKIWEAM